MSHFVKIGIYLINIDHINFIHPASSVYVRPEGDEVVDFCRVSINGNTFDFNLNKAEYKRLESDLLFGSFVNEPKIYFESNQNEYSEVEFEGDEKQVNPS